MENTKPKKKKNFINVLLVVLIIVAVCILGFSAYKLISINNSYQEASNLYADIEAIVASPVEISVNKINTVNSAAADLKEDASEPAAEEEETSSADKKEIVGTCLNDFRTSSLSWDFDALKKLCEDSVGYIYQKDKLSYPIVQAEDNDKYLRHLINGNYNTAGTLFVDYRLDEGLEGRYSIIYGHNMDDGSMFASLTNYADEEYYKEHPYFEVFIGPHRYIYYVYAAARIEENSDLFTFEMNDDEFLKLMEYARSLNTYEMQPLQVTKDSHAILLSTCIDYPRNYDYRYVVMLVRGKELLDPSYNGKLPWIHRNKE